MPIQRAIRDLSWAIRSPTLLMIQSDSCWWIDDEWCEQQCLAVDEEHFEQYLSAQPKQRLGLYFESLLTYWLRQHPDIELLAHNLPVRSAHKSVTVGAFDYIFRNLKTNNVIHCEVAVKFYLGLGDLGVMSSWHGPGLKDRLDIKTQHLLHHQSQLGRHAASKPVLEALGVEIDERWVILKGRLFYPWQQWAELDLLSEPLPNWLNPQRLNGWWMTASQFRESGFAREFDWLPLTKHDWLSERQLSDSDLSSLQSGRQLVVNIDTEAFNYPKAVLGFGAEMQTEQTRGFIVPDAWPGWVRDKVEASVSA